MAIRYTTSARGHHAVILVFAKRPLTPLQVEPQSSHVIPRNETIKEVVNWMEKYWGDTSR